MDLQLPDDVPEYKPKRVVSILSGSRCGSTLLKHAISLHPELISLAGEEEPYYKLSLNGYPFHEDDSFRNENDRFDLRHVNLIKRLITCELYGTEKQSWYNRRLLQWHNIEEPPFVATPWNEYATIDTSDWSSSSDTIVMKTPQNSYRPKIFEHLWNLEPEQVANIRIVRKPEATINGLLDGWTSRDFIARRTERGWWKFDMPPGWQWDTLIERCIHQYRSAKDAISKHETPLICTVTYEDLIQDWYSVCCDVWSLLGLPYVSKDKLPTGELPKLSVTDEPKPQRWVDKRPWLEELLRW